MERELGRRKTRWCLEWRKESAAGEGRESRAAFAKTAKMAGLRAAEGCGPQGQQPRHFRRFPRRPAPPGVRRTFLRHGGRVRLGRRRCKIHYWKAHSRTLNADKQNAFRPFACVADQLVYLMVEAEENSSLQDVARTTGLQRLPPHRCL